MTQMFVDPAWCIVVLRGREKRHCRPLRRRMRIDPLAVDGSTTRPCWVMTTRPSLIRRRAAARTGSIRCCQLFGLTRRAASEGQMVALAGRKSSRTRIASVRVASVADTFRDRQRSEQ